MRKKTLLFLMCALSFPVTAWPAEMYTLETIKRVISGDTFQLESGKKIRLIGVDVPEDKINSKAKEDSRRTGQDLDKIIQMGKTATDWVKARLDGKKIFLKYDVQKTDDRGAEWVYAYLFDVSTFYGGIVERQLYEDVQFEWWQLPERGSYIFLNATIIRGGYATPVRNPPNLKHADWLERVYWEAKEGFEGLWDFDPDALSCTEEGDRIGNCAGCVYKCCKGLMPMFDLGIGRKCRERPEPGSGGFCSNCGNKICESDRFENACSCPEDCK